MEKRYIITAECNYVKGYCRNGEVALDLSEAEYKEWLELDLKKKKRWVDEGIMSVTNWDIQDWEIYEDYDVTEYEYKDPLAEVEIEEVEGEHVTDLNIAAEYQASVNKDLEDFYIYERVNQCESYEELADVIESLTDIHGLIEGRSQALDGDVMAQKCRDFENVSNPSWLTRRYGIRQQAMYIKYYRGVDRLSEDAKTHALEVVEQWNQVAEAYIKGMEKMNNEQEHK